MITRGGGDGPGDVGQEMWARRCGPGGVGQEVWARRCGPGDVGNFRNNILKVNDFNLVLAMPY